MIALPPHPIELAGVAMARAFNGLLDKQSWSLDSARLHARPQEASHEQTGPVSCPHWVPPSRRDPLCHCSV